MDTAILHPVESLPEDILLSTAIERRRVRFLEISLRPSDGRLRAFANAYRENDLPLLNRVTVDSYVAELERAAGALNSAWPSREIYRSGEMRFISSTMDDERLWASLSGLKFNVVSVDARSAPSPEAALQLLKPILQHGLLDNDGFTFLFHGLGSTPLETLTLLGARLAERFALRGENLNIRGDVGVASL